MPVAFSAGSSINWMLHISHSWSRRSWPRKATASAMLVNRKMMVRIWIIFGSVVPNSIRRHGFPVPREECCKAYLVTICVDNSLDFPVPSLGQLVQSTHSPVFVYSGGPNDSGSLTVNVRLEDARENIDVLAFVDKTTWLRRLFGFRNVRPFGWASKNASHESALTKVT